MLNSVGRILETDKDRDHKVFTSGGQGSECIFHVGSTSLMDYLKVTRGIRLKKRLEKLACLVAAAITGAGENRDLKIICKPCREFINISSSHVLGNGHEYLIPSVLG